jgi:hypothetical protein
MNKRVDSIILIVIWRKNDVVFTEQICPSSLREFLHNRFYRLNNSEQMNEDAVQDHARTISAIRMCFFSTSCQCFPALSAGRTKRC